MAMTPPNTGNLWYCYPWISRISIPFWRAFTMNDAPLRGYAGCGQGTCRTRCPVLCGRPCLAVACPCRPIDVYPLLRPFAIGICIMLFPTLVLGTMNTVLSPIVQEPTRCLRGRRWTCSSTVNRRTGWNVKPCSVIRKRPIWSAMRSLTVSWTSSDGRPMHGNPHGHVYGSGHVQSGKEYP